MMVTQKGHPKVTDPLLLELAQLYGVLPSYRGSDGREVHSPQSSILAVLRSLGAELRRGEAPPRPVDLERAILARKLEKWRRITEPVVVAWEGRLPALTVRLPRGSDARMRLFLILEDGAILERVIGPDALRPAGAVNLGRAVFESWTVAARRPKSWPSRLPLGYHRLVLEVGRSRSEAVVISAPRRCWAGQKAADGQPDTSSGSQAGDRGRVPAPRGEWGIFAPLYALRSERDWGAGDLAELEALADWTGERGGSVVATLPLLASFLDEPFDPSPYRPVSRMFWNEFYLAVERIPEWEGCAAARDIVSSFDVQSVLGALRTAELVDYRQVMAVKRRVLTELAEFLFDRGDPARQEALASWLDRRPEAREYARFRAEVEVCGGEYPTPGFIDDTGSAGVTSSWPTSLAERYHLYCQWQMDEQIAALGRTGGGDGAGVTLFLDLPVGVHPRGFDVWRWPELFVGESSIGAPPDGFFSLGQYWNSPPLHPGRLREQGHTYLSACLRHHMRRAGYLRIDHVMSLHRLFWIPEGFRPADGAYVSYAADESYGILSLESHRHETVVVGEDLGTVPSEVRPAMRRHGVSRTWVAQTSLHPRAADAVGDTPSGAVASVNTHDMFPFAGFLLGEDIRARLATHQVDEGGARREMAAREKLAGRLWALAAPRPIDRIFAGSDRALTTNAAGPPLRAILARLTASGARLTLVSLEDLWFETRPQNVPGTGAEQPNWRRKTGVWAGLPRSGT